MSKYINLYTENLIYISRTKLAGPLVLIRSLHTLLVFTNAVKCVAKEQNNFTESSNKFSAKFVKCLLAQEFLKQICIYKKTGLIALANYISYTCR